MNTPDNATPQDAEEKAAALPPEITVANLDANGIFLGIQTINRANATPEHVEVAADCDLTPGAYRWNAESKRFDPLPRTVAKLDASGIFWGVQTIDRADITPEHVEVPADCDLTPGAYRWNATHLRFDPLPRNQRITQPGYVSLEEAVHELVQLAALSGKLPPRLAQWNEQFGMSIGRIGEKEA